MVIEFSPLDLFRVSHGILQVRPEPHVFYIFFPYQVFRRKHFIMFDPFYEQTFDPAFIQYRKGLFQHIF